MIPQKLSPGAYEADLTRSASDAVTRRYSFGLLTFDEFCNSDWRLVMQAFVHGEVVRARRDVEAVSGCREERIIESFGDGSAIACTPSTHLPICSYIYLSIGGSGGTDVSTEALSND